MKIALAGNPNSGKTTMFNALTGSNEHVGNWAGVTVDIKVHSVKKTYALEKEIVAVDLPGAYSISPFTSEEGVTRDYIINEKPDVIVNIVDATNLSRSLFFTTQLLELGIPLVIALNKSDINEKKNTEIDIQLLSKELGCPVISTVSTSHEGLARLMEMVIEHSGKVQVSPFNIGEASDNYSLEALDRKRFKFVNKLVSKVEKKKSPNSKKTLGDRIDALITNKWLGIPIFAVVMFLVFEISQVWVGTPLSDLLVGLLGLFKEFIASLLVSASPIIKALVLDGIIEGVSAVVSFLPLVMVLYFLIALLEDCGYMSRAAVVLDPIFKKVGLSGKSVIPFVVAVGCAVPGVMACRTIRGERERRATAMIAPFMPCGAKIPIIALFAGTFFNNAGWVSLISYLSGIVIIFISALIINKITGAKRKSYFIIELPDYKVPSFWGATKSMISRGWEYIVKAATIILICNMAVQIMQSFDWSFNEAAAPDSSILASVASVFSFIILPIVGVLSWQLAAATITGFIAKENVVGTLAVCFAGANLMEASGLSGLGALSFLLFNLFSPPCFAAIGAMNSELKSRRWFFGAIAFQLAVGYTVSYFVYTIGTLIASPEKLAVLPAIIGFLAVLVFALVILLIIRNTQKQLKRA